jgi:protein-L-isoaspartate(D-aspartate) O-methyltransferase
MIPEEDFDRQRESMVTDQLEFRRIKDQRVLEVMRNIPRHSFVPQEYQDLAYTDRPIPIGEGQTISQPYVVALMTQLLCLQGDENVLEIGTGSGYQAAILAALAKQVYTIERHEGLAERAAEVLQELGIENVEVHHGDGSIGWSEHGPYDGIMVTAAAPEVPKPLLKQLTKEGRLVLPVGGPRGQYLQCWRQKGAKYTHDDIVPVSFVPLRGKHGWEKDWDGFLC